MLNTEELITQYEKYIEILGKVCPEDQVQKISDSLGERLAIAPRSTLAKDGGNPGALISFLLDTASAAKKVSSALGCNVKSAVKVSLLHELGKIGSLENDLFIIQDSDWHREKLGQHYKYNEECTKMTIPHRTLLLLQHFNVNLNEEEFVALLTSQGMHYDDCKFYGQESFKNPLVSCLQSARSLALRTNT